jgi:hypothetical protein
VTGYELYGAILEEVRYFYLLHSVQTGCRAQPASYPVDTGETFPRVKRPGREASHSLSPSGDIKNLRAIRSLTYTSSRRGAQLSTGTALHFFIAAFVA